jgi:hypothetical protein
MFENFDQNIFFKSIRSKEQTAQHNIFYKAMHIISVEQKQLQK